MGALYRRLWVLRSRGRHAEARQLEDAELAGLLVRIRATEEAADFDARVDAIRDGEKARVAEAVAFAEILAPLLAERLGASSPAASAALKPTPRPRGTNAAVEDRGIADFIEEMLIQDRAGST